MYLNLPSGVRDKHPYHMYDEIKLQPAAVAESLRLVAEQGDEVRQAVASARRVLLTGCGTSFHAAQAGAWMLRSLSRGAIDAWPVPALELATSMPGLRPDDLVIAISHSGGTPTTFRAIERARASGADSALLTGFPGSPAAARAGHVLPTGYSEERSWAHTASYLAALATLAALANDLAVSEARLDLSRLPAAINEALELEEMAHRIAASTIIVERYREPPGIVIVGTGPNAATAHEGMLKVLETSYSHAQAFELEEILHGPLAAVTPETLLIILAPTGPSIDRAAQLARAAHRIGVVPIVLVSPENVGRFDDTHRLVLPVVTEALSPLVYVVPLQLFSYFLAIGKGRNPDLIHRDDERYRAARSEYE